MTPLNYIKKYPASINQYNITSAYELQLLIWAATLSDGIKNSNNQLAETLHTDRRTIINSINRLRSKKLIKNIGTKYHRILVASSEIVSLFNELNSEIVSPVNSEKVSQNGEKPDTHNIKNIKDFSSTLVEYWNTKGNLPEIRALTDQRKTKLKTRMAERLFADNWRQVIDKVSASRFCTGHNDRGWKVDIDWILKDSTNYTKVLEGKYDNGDGVIDFETTEEEAEALMAEIGK